MSDSLFFLPQMRRGARACLVPGLAVLVFSFVMGALARQNHWSLLYIATFCLGIVGASVQALALQMWGGAQELIPILIAGFAAHLRYVLIAASLREILADLPLPSKILALHFTTDSNWAVTIAEQRREGATSAAFLFGGGLVIVGCLTLGNIGGYFAALQMADVKRYGLDFAILGVFLCLLLSLWRSARMDLLPWSVAAFVACVSKSYVAGGWYIVIGSLAGALTAGVMSWRETPAASRVENQ